MCHNVIERKQGKLKEFKDDFYEQLKQFIPYLRALNVSGPGEPLVPSYFRNFLTELNWEQYPDCKITLTTNGSLLTPSFVDKLYNVPFKGFIISLNAATPKTYKHITGRDFFNRVMNNLEYLLSNIKRFKQETPFVQLSFVLMKANYDELPLFFEIIEKYKTGLILIPMEYKDINPHE